MLTLRRKRGETIEIGEDVKITIKGIVDGQVVVGIDAPVNVSIWRGEVADRIRAERELLPTVRGKK